MSDWYLKDPNGTSSGPFATMDIVQWITAGRVGPQHAVCGVGSNRWVPINDVPMFGGALASSRTGAARPGSPVERVSSASFVGAPPASRLSGPQPQLGQTGNVQGSQQGVPTTAS